MECYLKKCTYVNQNKTNCIHIVPIVVQGFFPHSPYVKIYHTVACWVGHKCTCNRAILCHYGMKTVVPFLEDKKNML